MKIYTKTGDAGETGLYRGGRVAKNAPRINACGSVDELNCWIGVIRSRSISLDLDFTLNQVQNLLFTIGADLATPEEAVAPKDTVLRLELGSQGFLESAIDQMDERLPAMKNFILPGGSEVASLTHLARAVCRRAERDVVALSRRETVNPAVVVFLNRLSDYLFTLARDINREVGKEETPWKG